MYLIWMLVSLNDWLKLYVYFMYKINKCVSEIIFIKSWNKKDSIKFENVIMICNCFFGIFIFIC